MSEKPIRIQLQRTKGWRMPPNTVVVSRPHRWGNPFRVGYFPCANDGRGETVTQERAVQLFKQMLREGKTPPWTLADIRIELRGKNLACWCKPGTPCHADVLLEMANT